MLIEINIYSIFLLIHIYFINIALIDRKIQKVFDVKGDALLYGNNCLNIINVYYSANWEYINLLNIALNLIIIEI